ncbi:response regulator transcription factor [Segnochrobactrum spirostomi]|uniref:Response regulator transcription factor n=1 Tax=Segnochrobactrum spirostomi TaxID=2608987 RepID=A0A6A7Y3Z9_9HYPH|nr:response regulator transcription factor [Segnochrobactrum spirostomi]MQT12482.1 response regulator transcription factor [Segnochrobactrum spirostomi]
MYVVVDHRSAVADGYVAGFAREGFPSLGFGSTEFREWLETASDQDLQAVQGFLLGDFDARPVYPELIRAHSRAPIIALSEERSLELTLELFTAGIDDVVRKPVHVREIAARSDAVWRRMNADVGAAMKGRLKVHFDGRDPEIDGEPLVLPRRERRILEHLVKNSGRRITKTQLFNVIYGIFNEEVDESAIEGHMSKLRKKLRQKLGHDVIDAKRYIGYRFVG